MTGGMDIGFACGLRLMIPRGSGRVRVRIDAGWERFFDGVVDAGEKAALVSLKAQYFRDYMVSVSDAATGEALFRHRFDPSGRDACIDLTPGKLGDQVAWMPSVLAFAGKWKCRTAVVMEPEYIPLFKDANPGIEFVTQEGLERQEASGRRFYAACHVGVFDDPLLNPTDYRHDNLTTHADLILGVRSDGNPPPIHAEEPPERFLKAHQRYVCVCATASRRMKMWNREGGWEALCRMIMERGLDVVDVSAERAFRHPDGVVDMSGTDRPLPETAGIIAHADAFVGLPSGMSWVAWAAKTPVVLISGFSKPFTEFATPYRVSPPPGTPCTGCYNRLSNRWNGFDDCPEGMGYICTASITPEAVAKKLEKALADRKKEKDKEKDKEG